MRCVCHFRHEGNLLPVTSDRGSLVLRDRPTERIAALAVQGMLIRFGAIGENRTRKAAGPKPVRCAVPYEATIAIMVPATGI
jgi:hypothetical protein